ncbi:MAG: hypothetical protein RL684_330 [Pseudomonadota bacterium]|jgi:hypothetical protein
MPSRRTAHALLATFAMACLLLPGAAIVRTAGASEAAPPVVPSDKSLGFQVFDRDETLAHAKRVGLMPTLLPAELQGDAAAEALVDATLTTWLEKAGITVVPTNAYQAIYDRLNHQVGGIYSPKSGEYRRAEASAVLDNAQREFIESQHLTALAYARVVTSKASFDERNMARWDGATDESRGLKPATWLAGILGATNTTGTLPAYSLLFGFTTIDGKVLYVRKGGIQLVSYHDFGKAQGSSFLVVPVKDRLRDAARIERAVRIVTQPLLYSGAQISSGARDPAINTELIDIGSAPLPPPGTGALDEESPFEVPREQIVASVHRVALAGLNVGKFQPGDEARERYASLVTKELSALGWEVVAAPKAIEQFMASVEAAGGLFDPYTGKVDEQRLAGIRKELFTSLKLEPAPDAILWPALQRRMAMHSGGNARWDGASQNAVSLGPIERGFLGEKSAGINGEGAVAAVSFAATLRGADDRLLYNGRGGIQVTSQLKPGHDPVDLAPAELFRDAARDSAAVHVALRALAMDPAALDHEVHPEKYRK